MPCTSIWSYGMWSSMKITLIIINGVIVLYFQNMLDGHCIVYLYGHTKWLVINFTFLIPKTGARSSFLKPPIEAKRLSFCSPSLWKLIEGWGTEEDWWTMATSTTNIEIVLSWDIAELWILKIFFNNFQIQICLGFISNEVMF